MYVTLIYSDGVEWAGYVDAYATDLLENSFHIAFEGKDYQDTVYHVLRNEPSAFLQTGIVDIGHVGSKYFGSDYNRTFSSDHVGNREIYLNDMQCQKAVYYYAVLYN